MRAPGRLAAVTLFLLLTPDSIVGAQESTRRERLMKARAEKAERLEPFHVSQWEARIGRWEEQRFPASIFVKGWRGWRPVIGGMPSGSGTVAGAGYIHGRATRFVQIEANARYSTRGYSVYDAELRLPPSGASSRFAFGVQLEHRNLTSLRFYGLGNDSELEDRTTYLLKDSGARAFVAMQPSRRISLRGESGVLLAETGPGEAGRSLESLFDASTVPHFGMARTEFGHVTGTLGVDLLEEWEQPSAGLAFELSLERYEDYDLNFFDFTRLVTDVRGYIPLGHRNRTLALRLRTSHSNADTGHDVPFYLMETLGGAKTIRGFREFRFRDRRNLLVQAEYRWEVWTYVDLAVFLDAGKVFSTLDDFNFSDMHTGVGFGIRTHGLGWTAFRIDFAKSADGYRLHIGGGPSF